MRASDTRTHEESDAIDEHATRRREWAGGWRSVLLPVLLVVSVAGFIFYFTKGEDSQNGASGRLGVAALPAEKNPDGSRPEPIAGRLAPDFILQAPDGQEIRLSDFRGHPVLLNFWASWCGPCRAEMPEIEAVYEANKASGLVTLGINVQESADKILEWAGPYRLTFPLVMDTRGDVTRAYRSTNGLPASYFIDPDGRVASVHSGQMSRSDIIAGLATILPRGSQ